jgi:hypothetical protein
MEVLLVESDQPHSRLTCLNADGRVRFRHEVDRPVTFGETTCPPVSLSRLFLIGRPGSRNTVWLAGRHVLEFPSVIQQIGADGSVRSEYWSNGAIDAFAEFDLAGRRVRLVGGVNNEFRGASLAVFDGEVTGSAPASSAHYRCDGCLPGSPTAFFVFPPSRLELELGRTAGVVSLVATGPDRFTVGVLEATAMPPDSAVALAYYTFDRDLRLIHAEMGSGFEALVRRYEAEKRVTPRARYRGPDDLYPVRRWNGQGFDLVTAPEGQKTPPDGSGAR